MDPLSITLAIVVAALFAALLAIFVTRRNKGEGTAAIAELQNELSLLRQGKSDLERSLAVEQERAGRIPEFEQALANGEIATKEMAAAKAAVEAGLAASQEAVKRLEETVADFKNRLETSEAAHAEAMKQRDTIRDEKGLLESKLAETGTQLVAKVEWAGKVQDQLEKATAALETSCEEAQRLHRQLATLNETLQQERKQSEDKLTLLTEAKAQMTQEFKQLAGDVMKIQGETFSRQNQEQIDGLLNPLRVKLMEFQQGLHQAATESTKERAILAEQIRHLSETSAKMTLETSNLTRALKGETQTQGAWGEMILTTILEKSGLRDGEEYVAQQSHAGEDGQRLRPDVIVNIPGGQKRMVIDAKVSLVAFEAYIAAESEAERGTFLARHLTSIRTHIKTLASKEYHAAIGTDLDYVVMFIPIEGALAIALQQQPDLTTFAVENNVAIATPTTLMIALRTVHNIWQVERRNRNADDIAARAGRIYDKLAGFLSDMTTMGARIKAAEASYNEAMGKLSTGRGSLVSQVSALKTLGARTSKSIPAALVDESGSEPENSEAELTAAE